MEGDSIYIIRTSEVPVALIEVGFMTNKDELEKLNSDAYQRETAEGVYQDVYKRQLQEDSGCTLERYP